MPLSIYNIFVTLYVAHVVRCDDDIVKIEKIPTVVMKSLWPAEFHVNLRDPQRRIVINSVTMTDLGKGR